jgi:hypothetical protein
MGQRWSRILFSAFLVLLRQASSCLAEQQQCQGSYLAELCQASPRYSARDATAQCNGPFHFYFFCVIYIFTNTMIQKGMDMNM